MTEKKTPLQEVRDRLSEIEAGKDDFEQAHADEDELYAWFVRWIAEDGEACLAERGYSYIREVALLVLQSADIDFERYCA